MSHSILKTGLFALTALLLAACGSQPRNSYEARQYDCGTCGTIQRIEMVRVADRNDSQPIGLGAALGAIIGGVAGSNVGSGDGRTVATVAGAVAGGVIGHKIQSNNNDRDDRQDAYRFDINLDDGRQAQVTQLEDPGVRIGSRVIIRDEQVYLLR
ncbi:MAG TPA: glycine zipper 2TM domain-containing protein [Steroidobacteraceae bacterium]|nr:glycine zipper 2TM domain-containing protein [Steroidobacteraceae bacterium]